MCACRTHVLLDGCQDASVSRGPACHCHAPRLMLGVGNPACVGQAPLQCPSGLKNTLLLRAACAFRTCVRQDIDPATGMGCTGKGLEIFTNELACVSVLCKAEHLILTCAAGLHTKSHTAVRVWSGWPTCCLAANVSCCSARSVRA